MRFDLIVLLPRLTRPFLPLCVEPHEPQPGASLAMCARSSLVAACEVLIKCIPLICASQNKKAHRNGIKKPAANKYSKTKGVSVPRRGSAAATLFPRCHFDLLAHPGLSSLPPSPQMDPKFLRNQVGREPPCGPMHALKCIGASHTC